MEITLFKSITTESALRQLEESGEKYKGLFVDMNNSIERKFIKEQASLINDMLKRLDRARIDTKKEFNAKVEDEAKHIRERLQEANAPYNDLIEAHKEERKAILDAEKAKQEAIELAKQIESDHEIAMLLNEKWDSDREQRERERAEAQRLHDEQVAREALERKQKEDEAQKQREENERLKRIADSEHVRDVNRRIVSSIMQYSSVDETQAKAIVKAIVYGYVDGLSISY